MAKRKATVRTILLAAGIVAAAAFLMIGIFRGEVPLVLSRAVNVCLECIGLGR